MLFHFTVNLCSRESLWMGKTRWWRSGIFFCLPPRSYDWWKTLLLLPCARLLCLARAYYAISRISFLVSFFLYLFICIFLCFLYLFFVHDSCVWRVPIMLSLVSLFGTTQMLGDNNFAFINTILNCVVKHYLEVDISGYTLCFKLWNCSDI